MKKSYFIIILLITFNNLFAQKLINLTQVEDFIFIGESIEFLEDRTGKLTLKDILQKQNNFKKCQSKIFKKQRKTSIYWFKFKIINNSNIDLWLDIGSVFFVWKADFYIQNSSGSYKLESKIGTFRPKKNRSLPYNRFYLKIPPSNREQIYYLRLDSGFASTNTFKIGNINSVILQQDYHDFMAVAFIGIIIALSFYNLFLFFSIKDKVYLFYIAYLLAAVIIIPYSSGFYTFSSSWFLKYFSVWHNIIYLFSTLFAVNYLELSKKSPLLNIWLWFVTFIIVIIVPIAKLFAPISASVFFDIMLVIYTISVFFIATTQLLKGNKNARFYFLGWSFVILSVIIRVLGVYNLFPNSLVYDYSLYIGFSLEALMFAFALGDRYNILKKEKQEKEAKYLDLVVSQNERLEKQVGERTKELNELNGTLLENNKELRMVNKKLDQQSQELIKVNQSKDRLFAIIGHDLRAPIGVLEGALTLVNEENLSVEKFYTISKELHRRVENVQVTLDNLLHWANTQMKGIKTTSKKISIFSLAQESQKFLQGFAQNKDIKVINNISKEDEVYADPNQIKLVFRNLINNALKFTASGGKIEIKNSLVGNFQKIEVWDNGIGISPELLENLFQKNIKVSQRGTGGEKGIGLGLLLCQEFIELNAGQIWVESKVGQGSKFCFTLPV